MNLDDKYHRNCLKKIKKRIKIVGIQLVIWNWLSCQDKIIFSSIMALIINFVVIIYIYKYMYSCLLCSTNINN